MVCIGTRGTTPLLLLTVNTARICTTRSQHDIALLVRPRLSRSHSCTRAWRPNGIHTGVRTAFGVDLRSSVLFIHSPVCSCIFVHQENPNVKLLTITV